MSSFDCNLSALVTYMCIFISIILILGTLKQDLPHFHNDTECNKTRMVVILNSMETHYIYKGPKRTVGWHFCTKMYRAFRQKQEQAAFRTNTDLDQQVKLRWTETPLVISALLQRFYIGYSRKTIIYGWLKMSNLVVSLVHSLFRM